MIVLNVYLLLSLLFIVFFFFASKTRRANPNKRNFKGSRDLHPIAKQAQTKSAKRPEWAISWDLADFIECAVLRNVRSGSQHKKLKQSYLVQMTVATSQDNKG